MAPDPLTGLRLHLEPAEPIEVGELTGALSGLARQFDVFARRDGLAHPSSKARLLVSNVSPGSIDINLLPDVAATLVPFISEFNTVVSFGKFLKELLDKFQSDTHGGSPVKDDGVSIRDCEDVVAITKPIAAHGGHQTFNTFQHGSTQVVLTMDQDEAKSLLSQAVARRGLLQTPNGERRERVSMIWKRLDKDQIKSKGPTPDKGLIEDIDPKPRAVHFTDDMAYLKREMMQDSENPYLYVYFVDVEVSRVSGIVSAYRIVGFHGKETLDAGEHPDIFS